MPNHTANILEVFGAKETITKMVEFVKDIEEDGNPVAFSCDKVIPMPPSLRITSGSMTDNGIAVLAHRNGNSESLKEMFNMANRANRARGYGTWNSLDEYAQFLIDSGCANIKEAQVALDQDWYEWTIDVPKSQICIEVCGSGRRFSRLD